MFDKLTFNSAFRSSFAVMFGYIPLGAAFGVLFQDLGYVWYFAPLMGIVVFAGAAQFLAIGLLSANAGLLEIAIATFIINSRHLFYGLSLITKYKCSGLKKIYMIFGLTDETYSLVTSTAPVAGINKQDYYFFLTLLNQSYWVLGCALGGFFGSQIDFNTQGMDFALVALFMVLVIEQYKKVRKLTPFIIAIISSIIAILFFIQNMLLVAIGLAMVILYLQNRLSK